MASNRGVAYMGTGKVEVQSIDFPKLQLGTRQCHHGVILKIVSTNICGSDQHMVRGRTTAPKGLILGHEITGEVIEAGRDVEYIKVGDLVSVPFNIACGRCRNCKEGKTGICLNVNPARPGAAYGYVDMGGWVGGQAEYVMVPYADFNLLKFPDRDQAMAKIRDLTLLSDIFPTGYHGAVTAGVGPGMIVYVAGAGPVGLACAAACQLLGAAVVIVGDMIPQRLAQARSFGCETVDLKKKATLGQQIEQILGVPRRLCRLRSARPRRGSGRGTPRYGAQLSDDRNARRRCGWHSGPLRDGRSGREGQGCQNGQPEHPHRPGLGEVAYPCHRAMSRDALSPPVDASDPA
jgi:glutathione-independent formaldehyde dehydrogenase